MDLNADFAQRVYVADGTNPWRASPMAGVERKMLDRMGDEVARATTIVRYAPGSHFSPHVHHGGEEFLVLDGVFQDEHGDYPAGSYVRNPPGTRHTPGAEPGCVILVKLWQFDLTDTVEVRLMPSDVRFAPMEQGAAVALLHEDARERVTLERWSPGAEVSRALPGGMEVLVIEGSVSESGDWMTTWDWLRLPAGSRLEANAGTEGAMVWVKSGHLLDTPSAPR